MLALEDVTLRLSRRRAVLSLHDDRRSRARSPPSAAPSGAGKSTLLDLIAGFLAPSSGRILVDGRDVTALPPEQRPVSILFQSETLFEHLSAARNVALGLPRTPIPPRIAAALAEVGLPDIGAAARRDPLRRPEAARRARPHPAARPARCCCSTSPSPRSTTRPAPRPAPWSNR